MQIKMYRGMGFKNLEHFNQSLLAKQGWRILQDPNSLLTRVLKGRYFRDVSFLEVSLGWSPSFILAQLVLGSGIATVGPALACG